MYIAKDIGLPNLHILGDSLVIINWAKEVSTLSIVSLEAWCDNIIKLMTSFSSLVFNHVYREHNERADSLSKEGLIMALGQLTFTDYCEGLVTGETTLQLF